MSDFKILSMDRRRFLEISAKGILLTALLQFGFPFPAEAHSPKEVVLSYDAAAKTLKVQITHGTSSPSSHYIEKVEIKKGGKVLLTTDYKSQPSNDTFTYTYPLEAATGDVLEVKAVCSIFGSKTEKLTVK